MEVNFTDIMVNYSLIPLKCTKKLKLRLEFFLFFVARFCDHLCACV